MRKVVPSVSTTVHVDDYLIEIEGQCNDDVLSAADEIDVLMKEERQRLGRQQPEDKQEVYATNSTLERQSCRMMHIDKKKQGCAAMLGVDLAVHPEIRRGLRRRVKLSQRLPKHKDRSKLIRAKLAGCKQASRAARRIYATGVLRGAIYGAEVTQYTEGQLQAVQRQARGAIGVLAAGVPLQLLELLHPLAADPAYHMVTAPFLQLAREWWVLGIQDGRKAPDELTGRELWQVQKALLRHQQFGKERHRHGKL
jgi:hypothetical protein